MHVLHFESYLLAFCTGTFFMVLGYAKLMMYKCDDINYDNDKNSSAWYCWDILSCVYPYNEKCYNLTWAVSHIG